MLRKLLTALSLIGREQLTTELVLSADEFEEYDISSFPITIAFHLREFNVSRGIPTPEFVVVFIYGRRLSRSLTQWL